MRNSVNKIDNTVKLIGDVKLGTHNVILPFTVLIGPLEIGDNNIIGPHVVIGSPGADTRNPRYDDSKSVIKIGDNNIIREFSAIQKPCYKDITLIGNDIYVMQGVNISHDVIIQDKSVLTASVALAGIVTVLEGAYIAMGITISQRCVIGQYSIVGQGSAVVKNIKPFSKYIPGKPLSVNKYAIEKYGFQKFENEISDYIFLNKKPVSTTILSIINLFDKLHLESEKGLY